MTIWQPDHVLTKEDADWLMEQGACHDALDYIGWTVAEAARARPGAAIRYAHDRLTDEQFAEAAKAAPGMAIVYACDRLTDEQFAEAARAEPGIAIMFDCDRLTDEQFAEAARADPWAARRYAPKRYAALMEVCK